MNILINLVLTLGLFTFVIIGGMVELVNWLVPGFQFAGNISAVISSSPRRFPLSVARFPENSA